MNQKGSLPLLILHILSHEESHGYEIARTIKDTSEGVLDYKEGTLYPTLHTMEKQGLVTSNTQKINGRKRRYYRITQQGREMLAAEHEEWTRYAYAVNRVLGTT